MGSTVRRRDLIKAGLLLGMAARHPALASDSMRIRPIGSSGETLPVVGLGTYNVFDVAGTPEEMTTRRQIVDALLEAGGSVIDTSPMYRRSEAVVGDVLDAGGYRSSCFLATKVWTDGRAAGEKQMRRSAELLQTDRIDLMNGVTDYRESAGPAMVAIMRRYRPDFIQMNYSLGERAAEQEVLPVAAELGVAVLINRPFMAGRLFRAVAGQRLPPWAQEFADSWGQFFLKFIISHPAVTCVIPATSKVRHMVDNAAAGFGPLPDEKSRRRMADFMDSL
jgi:aryl-alcohol dehydrogenase-like predicted oxidoreductase